MKGSQSKQPASIRKLNEAYMFLFNAGQHVATEHYFGGNLWSVEGREAFKLLHECRQQISDEIIEIRAKRQAGVKP